MFFSRPLLAVTLAFALASGPSCSCESSDNTDGLPAEEGDTELPPPADPAVVVQSCVGDAGCAQGEICLGGRCQGDPCEAVAEDFCASANAGAEADDALAECQARCVAIADPCAGVGCAENETCIQGQCVTGCFAPSPCESVQCGDDEFCDPATGACIDLIDCEGFCPAGTVCTLGCGVPLPPSPCDDKVCAADELCRVDTNGEAKCAFNPCSVSDCDLGLGQVCRSGREGAECVDTCKCAEPCAEGEACIVGQCQCVPDCEGKPCNASDGCGGRCVGSCSSGNGFDETQECRPHPNRVGQFSCQCDARCGVDSCGEDDGCGQICTNCEGTPGARCRPVEAGGSLPNQVGSPTNDRVCCVPDCGGKACGADDGCGGLCANGACPGQQECKGNPPSCQCVRQCAGKACGASDGCGGVCAGGDCPDGQICVALGDAAPSCCQPRCAGKACGGDNGCGGQCLDGSCPGAQEECRGNPPRCVCVSDCADKRCGENDGCGRACNVDSCPEGRSCQGDAAARSCQCQPQCAGKACGADNGCLDGKTCNTNTCKPGEVCGGPADSRRCVCDDRCPDQASIACGEPNSCGNGSCKGTCSNPNDTCTKVGDAWECQPATCNQTCGFFEQCIESECQQWCPAHRQCVASGECCGAGESCGSSGCVPDVG